MSFWDRPEAQAALAARAMDRSPVMQALADMDREREQLAERNYCEHGHYEEFDLDDPTWPKCKNENAT